MWLWKCKYICISVCIYVVMFILPRSHNLCQRYVNNEVFQLHQKDPDIVSQNIFLFGAYGKLGSCWWEKMRKFFASAGLLILYPSRENALIWSQCRPKLPNIISNLTILLWWAKQIDKSNYIYIVNFSPKNASGQFVQKLHNTVFRDRL